MENDPKSIHRTNKGQIFNDIFSLAKIGHVPYKEAFESTKYFSVENDLIPWRSALYSLKFIKTMFWRTPGFGMFKKYMESQMIRSYRILGFFSQKSESIDTQSLREDIVSWMCGLGMYSNGNFITHFLIHLGFSTVLLGFIFQEKSKFNFKNELSTFLFFCEKTMTVFKSIKPK